jgi:hypothetical protein
MTTHSTRIAVAAILVAVGESACATARTPAPATDARSYSGPPTTAAITPGDLRTRLYIFADDSMRGRAAGTPDNLRGTAYIERELRRLGVEPAGENGTYFQDVPLSSRGIASTSSINVGGRTFALGAEFVPRDNGSGMRSIDGAAAIYGGSLGDTTTLISREAAAGKLVVLWVPQGWSVNRTGLSARFAESAGVAVVSLNRMPADTRAEMLSARSIRAASQTQVMGTPAPVFFYASESLASALLGAPPATLKPGTVGQTARGQVAYERTTPTPGRNVVGVIRGSDPAVRGQYVALGAHNDHDPVRPVAIDHDSLRAYNGVVAPEGAESGSPVPTAAQLTEVRRVLDSLRKIRGPRLDSIMNGADDDGTGSMALLEIAEAFAKANAKPKRSILFVWHTGEEIGLVGSNYFTTHPTVPRDSIVAQLNIDMIGRGGQNDAVFEIDGTLKYGSEDFLEVVGSRKLSTELGDIADATNAKQPRPLFFSKVFDAPGDPHRMYCRSDHYNYARYGIPITFFFTSVHRDYHEVTDEPQYIDYPKYSRIVNLVHDIADTVANLDHRLVVDQPKPDPQGRCVA